MPGIRFISAHLALSVLLFVQVGCGSNQRADKPGAIGKKASNNAVTDSAESRLPKTCDGREIMTLEGEDDEGTVLERTQVVELDDGTQVNHGLTTYYWPNNEKKYETQFVCGVRHGPRMSWYEDGSLWMQGEYRFGKDHGTWTVWYGDGTKEKEFTLIEGAFNGPYMTWHPNGKVRIQAEFVNGMRQGPVRMLDDQGILIKQLDYADGIPLPTPTIN